MFSFFKMQATGNDFIIVDYINNDFNYSFKRLAEYLCNRKFGVGADGILIIEKSEVASYKMRIFNSDGSEAEMCGNGIRCFAKFLYEHNMVDKDQFKIETISGIKDIVLNKENERVESVKVDMGKPCFDFEKIQVYCDSYNILKNNEKEILNEKDSLKSLRIDNNEFYIVSLGNPHAVCFVDNLDDIDLENVGKKVENYKYFPNRINVEFVKVIDEKNIEARIWERGVGETFSCGTGACAISAVSRIVKSTNSKINVNLKGGKLKVSYDFENVYLEGEAIEVFEGKMKI